VSAPAAVDADTRTGAVTAGAAPSPVRPVDPPPPDGRRHLLLRRVPVVTSAAVWVAATVVLVVGWGLDVPAARTITGGRADMRPVMAVCLLLLAGALWLRGRGRAGDGHRLARAFCLLGPAFAGAVGLIALVEHALGVDLRVDRLLFHDRLLAAGGPDPGRPPVESAVGILLVAGAQLLLEVRARWALLVSQLAVLASSALALTILYGWLYYAFGVGGGHSPDLAAYSVLCLGVLAVGALAVPAEGGLAKVLAGGSVGAVVGRRMLLAALVVPFLLSWVPILSRHLLGSSRYGIALLVTGNAVGFAVISFVAVSVAAKWEALGLNAQDAAAESHRQLLALIDNTSAVIYMRDLEGRYMLINREFERLFSVHRDHVCGHTDHDLFPKDVADAFRENDRAAVARGRPVQVEEVAPGEDGPHTYVTVKFPILDAAGQAYAVCGISTDITARQRAEEEVRRLNEGLEVRILERTAELEASTRELDAFAYSVSHDLRAPLRSLDGFSQALAEDCAAMLDETGKDYLRRIQSNAVRMGQMIDDLLNLSRTTRLELRRQPVDLAEIAADVLAELRETSPDRQIEVVVQPDLAATGDAHLLRLTLMNLIGNAWKFTGKVAAARVEIGRGEDDGELAFFVRDNGAGFDMAHVHKLFDPFNRLHSRSDFDGSGLGLAIVQRIVRRHGGRVWAVAAPGVGATFYFTLAGGPRTEKAKVGVAAADSPADPGEG
jgi:PAS domain S-box-containing protein